MKDASVWSTEALSNSLGAFFENRGITVQSYHHLIVAIAQHFLHLDWGDRNGNHSGSSRVFGDDDDVVVVCNELLDTDTDINTDMSMVRTRIISCIKDGCYHFDICMLFHNFLYGRRSPSTITKSILRQLTEHKIVEYAWCLRQERLHFLC
jgi:hypothetical protein